MIHIFLINIIHVLTFHIPAVTCILMDILFLFSEEKKVEKKVESDSEDDDMGFGLFD